MDKFLKLQQILFITSHTSKEVLKGKYSVSYNTSVLLLLIIVAKKSLEHFRKMMSMYSFSRNRTIYIYINKGVKLL